MHRLAITLGDPAGIGPEVVFKAIGSLSLDHPVAIFGDWSLSRDVAARHMQIEKISVAGSIDAITEHPITFVDVGDGSPHQLRYGAVDAHCGAIALRTIETAVTSIDRRICDALLTAPVNKEAILAAGSKFPGHTELLAARAGLHEYGRDFAMYFDSPTLRVALLSVHVSLRTAINGIFAARIIDLARLIDREYKRLYGTNPRIAVAGLNPHAGEGGHFGEEEREVVSAVESLSKEGLSVTGPFAADTLFLSAMRGRHDVVIALYHDQGLIAVKSVAFDRSVNVTLGLPYLRASVDHGTAFDIAGQGIADPEPMRYAMQWAAQHSLRMRR